MLSLRVEQFWSKGVSDIGITFANVVLPRQEDLLLHTWEFKQDKGAKSA